MEQQRSSVLLQEYGQIKQSLTLPVKLRLYFSLLQAMAKQQQLDQNKQQILDHNFISIFQKLSSVEKAQYLHWMITHISHHFKSNSKEQVESNSSLPLDSAINNIQTSCKIEAVTFGISTWNTAKFKLDKFARRVEVVSKQRSMSLNLEDYLIRNSKKHKNTIVLEAASKRVSPDLLRASIYFTQSIFKQLQRQLVECVMESHRAKLMQMSSFNEKQEDKLKHMDHSLIFLNSEDITSFLKYKAIVLERITVQNLHFRSVFEKKNADNNLKVSRSSKINKIFQLSFTSDLSSLQLKKVISNAFRTKFKFRVQQTLLQQFSKKYQAVYEKFIFNGQVFDQINLTQEGISQREEIYFSKGIDNVLTPNIIEFILIQVANTESASMCKVFASLSLPKQTPEQFPINLMLEFNDMIERGKEEQMMLQQTLQEEFFSIIETGYEDDVSIEIQHDGQMSKRDSIKTEKEFWLDKKSNRIPIEPLDLTETELKEKIIKDNFVFKEWKRAKSGGLVCSDMELIADQKKMIKKIISSIGNNIFKILRTGSGIINMCLPVTIFKKESHLQSIARNLSYAPLLLDKFRNSNDYIERFKHCILFVVSTCNLSISMMKPFNPILGETYQCWMGGCPLYFEQISHHPPISSFYFKGRGFTMSGSISPKISASGLNSAKCWSEKINYIEFQDGSKTAFLFPKMGLKNLIMGEREFHFIDKVLVYDMKNNYFAELFFGPIKRGFLSSTTDPEDYIHGNIYRTTTAFLSKFKASSAAIYPSKEDIAKEISTIEGIWSERVVIDGKEYLDLAACLPYQMENQHNPLPSDSQFRADIQHIIKNQLELSQQFKEKYEKIQRQDKKLREAYMHKQ